MKCCERESERRGEREYYTTLHKVNSVARGKILTNVESKTWTWPRENRIKFIDNDKSQFFHIFKHKHKILVVEKIPTTPSPSGDCICVPYYQCNSNNTIITDGIGIIDVRAARRCTGDLEICCKLSNLIPRPPPPSMASIVTPTFVPTGPPTFATSSSTHPPTSPPTQPPTSPPTLPPTQPPTSPPTQPPTSPPTSPPTQPPTSPPTSPPTQPPTSPPTQPPTSPPTQPPTSPPTQPPTSPPTQPPTSPPTQPPTSPPTQPPTSPPTSPPTQPPTSPPTQPPTSPPTQPPTSPPTQPPTSPPTQPPTSPPTSPPTQPPTQPPTSAPITQSPTLPPYPCICVDRSLCDSNGFLIIAGEGIINPRQTQYPCPLSNQICCRIPTNTITFPSMPSVPGTIIIPSPQQNTCACVKIFQCNPNGFIIISGAGIVDPRWPSYRQGQIGTCSQDETCCRFQQQQQFIPIEFPTNSGAINPGGFNPRANLTTNQITNTVVKNPGTTMACICVKSFMCPLSNVVVVDPTGIIDSRFRYCASADEVCCRTQSNQDTMQVILPGSNFVVIQNGIVSGSSGITKNICGVSGPRCLPGDCPTALGETYFGEFPWMVAIIVRREGGSGLFLCGGSMINNRAVLTAAHCVLNRERGLLVARFGEWNTADNAESLPYQESEVQSIITHPNYYKDALYHDVAVLILSKPVQMAVNIQPICLPQQGMIFPSGVRCLATGWGRSGFEGQYQTTLKKIDLPLVDVAECQRRLRSTRLGEYFQLHKSFLCAGGEAEKDTCTGDGGGPLVCPTASGQYIQVGIVSWGIGCGASDVPAVYADVAQHRQWIDQQLANYGVL